ncbi:MAG TPA: hypothetical protein VL989_00850 [Candidatus Sulfotelmatobacter sp.]|nr:hypothetical protein [Candidatus Sulfotelmatobacter sp.]
MKLARLHNLADIEPYWHVHLALIIAIALQLGLSDKLTIGPKYWIAGFEVLLIIALAITVKRGHRVFKHIRRAMAIVLIAIISAANIVSLVLVINDLFNSKQISGKELIISGLAIYVTNIIIFGVWYWELDSGGSQELNINYASIDFLFPQMTAKSSVSTLDNWKPTFFDYLYVSITNAVAFSPTDTMPLTHRAKALMGLQSAVSLTTIALVAARAVNILV